MSTALRVVVVDDEQLAREELCYQLEQIDGIQVVAQASNGIEALGAVEQHEPDLVFLDIQMPGLGRPSSSSQPSISTPSRRSR